MAGPPPIRRDWRGVVPSRFEEQGQFIQTALPAELAIFDPSPATADKPDTFAVSALPDTVPAAGQIVAGLGLVGRALEPLAASFGRDAPLETVVVDGRGRAAQLTGKVASWLRELQGVSPLGSALLEGNSRRVLTVEDVSQGGHHPVFDEPARLRVYRRLGVIDDVRLPIRASKRLLGSITLWRPLYGNPWTEAQLSLLDALQPLLECGYAGELREWRDFDATLPAPLTQRQRQVARLLAGGATNREIAAALYVGQETVKSHVKAVLQALDAGDRGEVARRYGERLAPPAGALTRPELESVAARLLDLLLDWARCRLGTGTASCLLLSARGESLAQATIGDVSAARRRPLTVTLRLPGRGSARIRLAPTADSPVERRHGEAELRAAQPVLSAAFADLLYENRAAWERGGGLALGRLTRRELQVVELAVAGAGDAEIARRLRIARSTTENHMARALSKSGAGSRAQLIAMFAAASRRARSRLPPFT